MYFYLVFLSLHLYIIDLLKGLHCIVVCLFASVHKVSKSLSFRLVSGFLNIKNIFNFGFDSKTESWRYSCLFPELYQSFLQFFCFFLCLSPSMFHFWNLFMIIHPWNAGFHDLDILFNFFLFNHFISDPREISLNFIQFSLQVI